MKASTNWNAVSNLIGDCWTYIECNDGFDSAFLSYLLEVVEYFVDEHLDNE